MVYTFIGLIFFLALFFQGSITTLPLLLIVLLLLYIFYRHEIVFLLAFISGVILDSLLVRSVGQSSIFFLSFLFLVFLYQRKFEISSYYFIFFSLFGGSCFYFFLFYGYINIFPSFFLAGFGIGVFYVLKMVIGPRKETYHLH